MTDDLLERAIAYLLAALPDARADLDGPTPCHDWNLRMLLAHIDESLTALREGFGHGRVCHTPTAPRAVRAGAPPIRMRATGLLGDWTNARPTHVTVDGRPIPVPLFSAVAALELTVHAWDLTAATHTPTPIPHHLARELLTVAPQLVPPTDRHPLFAPPLPTPTTTPSNVLLAYLGRAPR
ncbi:hypothetical protein [Nocardia sp. NPDC052566]|uniref:hypothetical protein n=1 Tax=Nocardia sp. NPDC052566 TaxID=3364330 RepID=UPI0037CB4B69